MDEVIPVFKKDDETEKLNYRPVTVLPSLNIISLKGYSPSRCKNSIRGYYRTNQYIDDTTVVKHHCCG